MSGQDNGGARTSRPPTGDRRLSVVIPALDCADHIGTTVERVAAEVGAAIGRADLEVIVVDDGSTDATADLAEAAGADLVLRLAQNLGKGGAVRNGVLAASGRTIAFTDADLAYDPQLLLRLLEEVERGSDVAIGSRAASAAHAGGRLRALGSRIVNLASRLVLHTRFADTQCGLKAFRNDVARSLFSVCRIDGFAMDIEVLHLCERRGHRVVEVAVQPRETEASTVRIGVDTFRLFTDVARIRWRARSGADLRGADAAADGSGASPANERSMA